MLQSFILRVRNKDNKFYAYLHAQIKNIRSFSLPCIKPFFNILWWERNIRLAFFRWCVKSFYYVPLFKSRCYKVGKKLYLINGLPYIGDNLRLVIGDNVTIYGDAGFGANKVFDEPLLKIGDNTYIGPRVRIGVGKEIRIGKHCLIAARVLIADHDGHPLDWRKRREGLPVEESNIKPISIEDDVWIGEGAFICKGVVIGRGAIVAARSVVTKNVPPFSIVGGNPAKVIRFLEEKPQTQGNNSFEE